MPKIKNCFIICIVLLIVEFPIWSQNIDNDQKKEKNKSFLLYLRSPIVKISSQTGLTYDLIPIGFEIPFSNLIGLRLEPGLVYYPTEMQYFHMPIILPFYLSKNTVNEPYGGLYLSPFFDSAIVFVNNTIQFGAGVAVGFAWNPGTSFHLNSGLGFGYSFSLNQFNLFLDLNIGYWL